MKLRSSSPIHLAIFALAVPFLQSTASAADLPVVYSVQDKPLKQAVAGTELTFNLYSDPACSSLLFTQTFPIDEVDVISKLKIFTPKGVVKPPKTDEIHAVLAAVPPLAGPYLRVTGTGVVPADHACQLQTSGIEGPQGVVGISDFHGAIADLDGNAPTFVFAGPTTAVTTTSTQRITGSAVMPLGKGTLGENNVALAMCFKSIGGGSITTFLPDLMVIEVSPGGPRHSYAVAASVVPGAGTWVVGACARNDDASTLNDNGNVNGWVMVTN